MRDFLILEGLDSRNSDDAGEDCSVRRGSSLEGSGFCFLSARLISRDSPGHDLSKEGGAKALLYTPFRTITIINPKETIVPERRVTLYFQGPGLEGSQPSRPALDISDA